MCHTVLSSPIDCEVVIPPVVPDFRPVLFPVTLGEGLLAALVINADEEVEDPGGVWNAC